MDSPRLYDRDQFVDGNDIRLRKLPAANITSSVNEARSRDLSDEERL
jgi:hypothetical protein